MAGRLRSCPQLIVRPPLTLTVWPVTNDASSEARNATTLATSAGWPSRRNGIALVRASRSFGPAKNFPAIALPMPWPAPVTIAILSLSLPMRDILVLTQVGLVVMGEDNVTERDETLSTERTVAQHPENSVLAPRSMRPLLSRRPQRSRGPLASSRPDPAPGQPTAAPPPELTGASPAATAL